jgi:CRP-like cAMP-binding protein
MPMDTSGAAARLAENAAFSRLDHARLVELIAQCELRSIPRGGTVLSPGGICEGLHAVLDGQVKVFARAPDGHEKVIDVVGRGETLPGTHMTHAESHPHHAQALTAAVVLVMPGEVLRLELQRDPDMATRLLDDAARQVRRMMREIESTTLRTAMERVCNYLLHLPSLARHAQAAEVASNEDEQRVVELPVSKNTVASLLSITPEHFSRILRELHLARLIHMHRREICIPDPDRLAIQR